MMYSFSFTAATVMRPSATFVGLTRVTSGTEPVGRRTPAADGVGVRRSRCATIIAARESRATWHVLRTITVAIDDSRAKAHPSEERRRDVSVSPSLRGISCAVASSAPLRRPPVAAAQDGGAAHDRMHGPMAADIVWDF